MELYRNYGFFYYYHKTLENVAACQVELLGTLTRSVPH